MKFDISVRAGSHARDHYLEISALPPSPGLGRVRYVLGEMEGEVDCAQIVPGIYSILVGGRSYEARVARSGTASPGREASYHVTVGGRLFTIAIRDPRHQRHHGLGGVSEGPQNIFAPMPGKIVKLLVEENQEIAAGAGLLVIEAMKMQNELRAPQAGRVKRIYVKDGDGVESGFRLLQIG